VSTLTGEQLCALFFQDWVPAIIAGFITIIPVLLIQYSRLRDKNKYANVLKKHSPHVKAFLNTIKNDKLNTVITFYSFLLGLIVGFWIIKLYIYETASNLYDIFLQYFMFPWILSVFVMAIPSFIIIILSFIYYKLIKYSHILNIKCPVFCVFGKSQMMITTSCSFLFGVSATVYLITDVILIYFNLMPNFQEKTLTLFYILFFLLISLLILLNLYCLIFFYKTFLLFYKKVIKPILNYHESNFPYIKIKTMSCDIEGQLNEIQDKSTIALIKEGKLNFVSWDKIIAIEIRSSNEHIVFDNKDK